MSTIASDVDFNVAILEDGSAIAWGINDYGQCNIPDIGDRKFVQVSVISGCCLAILDDGSAIAWGDNQFGLCDIPDTDGLKFLQISENIAILEDGSAITWANEDDEYEEEFDIPDVGDRKFIQVSGCLGLLDDGSVVRWGHNDAEHYQLRRILNNEAVDDSENDDDDSENDDDDSENDDLLNLLNEYKDEDEINYEYYDIPDTGGLRFVQVSSGDTHYAGILEDGSVIVWGSTGCGQYKIPDVGDRAFVQLSSGGNHIVAILEDGSCVDWGHMDDMDTDRIEGKDLTAIPDIGDRKFVQVSAAQWHTLAILDDGTAIAWGNNNFGQCNIPDTGGRKFMIPRSGKTIKSALKS